MPEKLILLKTYFVAAITENIVLTKFINFGDSSGSLNLMRIHAFRTSGTNNIIAALGTHIMIPIRF